MAQTVGIKTKTVTVIAAGTAVKISNLPLTVSDFELHIVSGNSGSNMYIGNSAVTSSSLPRPAGTDWNFTSGTGNLDKEIKFDLSKIFLDADSAGDQAIISYFELED